MELFRNMSGDMEAAEAEVEVDPNQKGKRQRSGIMEAATEESEEVPPWRTQVTGRAIAVSLVLSVFFTFTVMKINISTGIVPSLNVSAGLLGFVFLKTWTQIAHKCGFLHLPFTRQENSVIQTCVVASSGIAFSGGFGNYLYGMSGRIRKQSAADNNDFKDLSLGWIIGFLFLVSFLGLFSILLLRKVMIIDLKLTYPSGTATAHLINICHTPRGAKKQVRMLGKFFSLSFFWSFFQWFFAAGHDCGFASFPTFGLRAYNYKFYFNFSAPYVGLGMMCPYIVSVSMLLGGLLSWGLMWPLIEKRRGDWYNAELEPSSFRGLQGYKVFTSIALILGDGTYTFVKVLVTALIGLHRQMKKKDVIPVLDASPSSTSDVSFDDKRRTQLFLKDQIPPWFAIGGYVAIATLSIATLPHIIPLLKWYYMLEDTLPHIFPQLKWYHILIMYLIAPVLAFCNAFGVGLTDWSFETGYAKLAILVIGTWVGAEHGGVTAGLAASGIIMNIVSTAAGLMQDFKTGYMTLSSPRSIFVSQVIGTAMGCIISPCVFWLFYKKFADLGLPKSSYPMPYAEMYHNMARLAVDGVSTLPKHCLNLSYGFFAAAIVINLIKDLSGKNISKFIPIPMALGMPFYLGPYFAIDMCLGCLILFMWEKIHKTKAEAFAPVVAAGLICGDGLWAFPSSILALAGVKPPICMKFLSRATNVKVDNFLGTTPQQKLIF